jgi:hypothetical protein
MSLIRGLSISLLGLGVVGVAAAQQKAAKATTFTVRIENASRGEILKLSNGKTAPFVIAPVLWAVHTGNSNPLFVGGQPDAGNGLRTLAETGNPDPLSKWASGRSGVIAVGADANPVGDKSGGPLTPGKAYEFTVTAEPGQVLSIAAMFGQSNDWFYSNDRPIALFASGKPVTGDRSAQISLWDAGTEVDEEPGLGPNQAPRQKDPEAGVREHASVAHAARKWSYPRGVFKLTVTPQSETVSQK